MVKGDNECYSEIKKNQSRGMLSGARPEKGHLAPEVKEANEIAYDYVWDKLYPPPPNVSITCYRWYRRKPPLPALFSGLSLWTSVH
jgi:hypothetical protein